MVWLIEFESADEVLHGLRFTRASFTEAHALNRVRECMAFSPSHRLVSSLHFVGESKQSELKSEIFGVALIASSKLIVAHLLIL